MSLFETRSADSLGLREVLYEKSGWSARVTINRPRNYNVYSTPALRELATAFEDASQDDRVAVVVFTGAGDCVFCMGGDVKACPKCEAKGIPAHFEYCGKCGAKLT
jgi:enoyl-CoA hydratase/carnithine racemase